MDAIAYNGEILALLTAVTWAVAVILFKKSGETVHPLALNLFKCALASVLIALTLFFLGQTSIPDFTGEQLVLLLLSGVIGIGVSDTLLFKCLNLLGAGMTAIVDCLYSPLIIFMSFLWLHESLSFLQIVGAGLIVSAVLFVSFQKRGLEISRRNLITGLIYGVLAMVTVALGIVMIKPILSRLPLIWVTEIRVLGGILILALITVFHPKRRNILGTLLQKKGRVFTLLGSFFGSYLAQILWIAGMAFTQASIAAALNQTCNIFIFVFAAIFLREPLNRYKVIGIFLGIFGVFLVILF